MIDIPEYKDFETMNDKIKYAIETCGEIDDDYSAGSIRGEDEEGNDSYWAPIKNQTTQMKTKDRVE